MNSKRSLIFFLTLFLFFVPFQAQNNEKAISDFLRNSGISKESVAVKIVDLTDGSTLLSHNEDCPLIPASIMKSVTTASLLQSTGPDWKYHTRIFVDGPNDFGYLRGNIIIEGACDPTVNSEKEPYSRDIIEEICMALKAQNINRIEGEILIDEGNFKGNSCPDSWAKEDRNKYYGTGSHAFNFSDNSRGDFAVHEPSLGFIDQLAKQLQLNGIELEGKNLIQGKRKQIHDHQSASIDEIMRSCMMRSDNLFAEAMLRTYGKIEGSDGSTPEAVKRETELWRQKNLPLEGVQIIDGSGLSRSNRVTANFMSALLREMSDNPHYASFFPLAGQEGTLKKFLVDTPLDSYIAMKTGSMRGIQCYAGYKLDDDYMPTHVIVIIMNEINKSREKAKKAAEDMLLAIFSYPDQDVE